MAITNVGQVADGAENTSDTTLTVTFDVATQVGDLLHMLVACDPLSASTPTITSITDTKTTWTQRDVQYRFASSLNGIFATLWSGVVTTAHSIGNTLTINLSGAVPAKAAVVHCTRGADTTATPTLATSAVGFGAATGDVTLTPPAAGSIVFAGRCFEHPTAPTAVDTDTTQGSWSSSVHIASTGSGNAAMSVAYQTKIVTGTSAQTHSMTVTGAGTDWASFAIAWPEAATGINVNLGAGAETGTAQAFTRAKDKALGLVSGTETLQALTTAKAQALGLASATEAAEALTRAKDKALGLVGENGTALALTPAKARRIGQPPLETVPGLLRRWRADAAAAAGEGGPVTSWTDIAAGVTAVGTGGGGTYHSNQAAINSRAVVRFDGATDSKLITPDLTVPSLWTLIAVAKTNTQVNTTGPVGIDNGTGKRIGQLRYLNATTGTMIFFQVGNTQRNDNESVVASTDWHVLTGVVEHNLTTLYIDGTSGGGTVGSGGEKPDTDAPMSLGTTNPNLGSWAGDVAELFLFDHALTAIERAVVHGYIADYYGLALADYPVGSELARETEAAQALTRVKDKALGLVGATEAAQALTKAKAYPLDLAAATEAAQAIGQAKALGLGLVTELVTIPALTVTKSITLGLAAEATAMHDITPSTSGIAVELGVASEVPSVHALLSAKAKMLGAVDETVTVGALTAAKELGLAPAAETGTVHALTSAKTQLLGVVDETTIVHALASAKAKAVEVVAEASTVHVLTSAKAQTLGAIVETSTLHVLTPVKELVLAAAAEASTVHALTLTNDRALGLVSETGIAHALTTVKAGALGFASEIGAAHALVPSKAALLGLLTETSTAHSLVGQLNVFLGLAVETGTVHELDRAKTKALGLAAETDVAFSLEVGHIVLLGAAAENGGALELGRGKALELGVANEAAAVHDLARAQTVALGLAVELGVVWALAVIGGTPLRDLIVAVGALVTDCRVGRLSSTPVIVGTASTPERTAGITGSPVAAGRLTFDRLIGPVET